MDQQELIAVAATMAQPFASSPECQSGGVAAALMTAAGNVYTGVSIDTECSLGFCAEHAAGAGMLKGRESEKPMIVAVDANGNVLPPCGACGALLLQVI